MRPVRRHARIMFEADVLISTGTANIAARAQQIGGGGMALRPEGELAVSQPVQVSFVLPNGPSILIAGVVWWKRAGLIGIRFDYSGEQRLRIERWIDENLQKAGFFARPI
jgi:hypothetical protein